MKLLNLALRLFFFFFVRVNSGVLHMDIWLRQKNNNFNNHLYIYKPSWKDLKSLKIKNPIINDSTAQHENKEVPYPLIFLHGSIFHPEGLSALYTFTSMFIHDTCCGNTKYPCSAQMKHPLLYSSKVVDLIQFYFRSNLQWVNSLSECVAAVLHFVV